MRLQKHLKPYVGNATIAVGDETQIKTGTKWRDEIAAALAAAEKDGLTIVWVPISASSYTKTPIADFQAAHDPASPLDSLSEPQHNKALVEICKKIEAA